VALNLGESTIKFITINSPQLGTGCNEKYIEESIHTKFLYVQIDNCLNYKNHINKLTPKLCGGSYAVRSVFHNSNINNLRTMYFAYFHSIIKYGTIFVGNLFTNKNIFTLQKKIATIMVAAKPRNSRSGLFKRLEILLLPCEYILSLTFIVL
jgi:hypothetical protein